MNSSRTFALRPTALTTAAFILLGIAGQSQEAAPVPASRPGDASVRELDSQVRELRAMVEEMRAENAQSRAEMRQLRQELQDTRKLLSPIATATGNSAPTTEAAAAEQASSTSPSGTADRRRDTNYCRSGKPHSETRRIHAVAGLES